MVVFAPRYVWLVMSVFFLHLCLDRCVQAVRLLEKEFEQKVDHFDFSSRAGRTYKQRYLMTDQFWRKGVGPIFLYTGNEGDVWSFANNTGLMFELAPSFGALVVFAEHRYYGTSLPFGTLSFERENVGLLSIEQTLADFATLLLHLQRDLGAEKCPVIAFGGSYGGMLSAYFRMKYPNLVAGALAASSPLYLVAGLGDEFQFFRDVTADFERYHHKCPNMVRAGFAAIKSLASKQQWVALSSKMRLCGDLNSSNDLPYLEGWIRNAFTVLAMMDYPYKTTFMSPMPANPVNVACDILLKSDDPLTGLRDAAGIMYNSSGTKNCYNIFEDFKPCADPTGCGVGWGSLAWDYQACTEINLLCSSNGKTDMFPVISFTSALREQYCQKQWGVTPRQDWLATQYWGTDLRAASNIIFSNGDLDPWANGGIRKNLSQSLVSIMISGGAHHLDLRSSNPKDPPSVIQARKQEELLIRGFIQEAVMSERSTFERD
uniref:Dipeptidyl peptidase 2 n=1 Tax=Eptatretus burgeri TaxID=7764 RepID=A0A8C4MZL6_EPTBU